MKRTLPSAKAWLEPPDFGLRDFMCRPCSVTSSKLGLGVAGFVDGVPGLVVVLVVLTGREPVVAATGVITDTST